MERIGQAEANARLTAQWMRELEAEAPVHFAGSGPGQMLEYLPAELLQGRALSFSDINAQFLERCGERLERLGVTGQLRVDDIENTALAGSYPQVVIALVLEHVDWLRALDALARWQTQRALVIVQENPPEMQSAVTPGRTVPGTMQVFREQAKPHLIPVAELEQAMQALGFACYGNQVAEVLDGKRMVACRFATSRTATAWNK